MIRNLTILAASGALLVGAATSEAQVTFNLGRGGQGPSVTLGNPYGYGNPGYGNAYGYPPSAYGPTYGMPNGYAAAANPNPYNYGNRQVYLGNGRTFTAYPYYGTPGYTYDRYPYYGTNYQRGYGAPVMNQGTSYYTRGYNGAYGRPVSGYGNSSTYGYGPTLGRGVILTPGGVYIGR